MTETDWENYESGPYCRHWADPSDCEICLSGCANCGHSGLEHDFEDNGKCNECSDCPGWKDKT